MVSARTGAFRVGTSGYQYDHWAGAFYPDDLPRDEWFAYYAERFDTVEINNTFYGLPEPETFDEWRERAPAGFCYALKFSRYGTHLKHLKDPEQTIGAFLERAERLGPLLGPILVQLRPNWHVDAARLRGFLDAAPQGRRWALEFRDRTWLCEEVFSILHAHNAALCVHDMIDDHPRVATADWVYLRFHGGNTWGDYTHQALGAHARRIKEHMAHGRDVFAYFNNDAQCYAIHNAADLERYVAGGRRGSRCSGENRDAG